MGRPVKKKKPKRIRYKFNPASVPRMLPEPIKQVHADHRVRECEAAGLIVPRRMGSAVLH